MCIYIGLGKYTISINVPTYVFRVCSIVTPTLSGQKTLLKTIGTSLLVDNERKLSIGSQKTSINMYVFNTDSREIQVLV